MEEKIMKQLVIISLFMSASFLSTYGSETVPAKSVNPKKGSIIKTGGYTSQGLLYREPDDVLSRAVKFTQDSTLKSPPAVYSTADLEGFSFVNDSAVYEAVDYSFVKDSAEAREKRFARLLVRGYATLYRLQLPAGEQKAVAEINNTCAYIVRINGEDNILRETEKTSGTDYTLVKKYIGTLKTLFKDCPVVQKQLTDLRFNDDAMITVVRKYCACGVHPNDSVLTVPRKSVLEFFHEPEAGISFFKLGNWGQIYSIGYVLETVYPEMSDRLSLTLGAKYNHLVHKGEKSINGFEIPILLGYNFDNDKVGPFINYGGNLHYFYIDNRFYSWALNTIRAGLKLYGVKAALQVEASNIIDMIKVGQIKIYTITLGYEF
jgi:hypothetical protein